MAGALAFFNPFTARFYCSVPEFIIYAGDGRFSSEQHGPGWVFSARNKDDEDYDTIIQQKITCLLNRVICRQGSHFFVQFWVPKQVGGRSIITTSDQPFAVSDSFRRGVSWYRKTCTGHRYIVDGAAEQEQLGPPGRVFRYGNPEYRPSLCLYSAKQFPLRDYAASCGLEFYIALPLFDLHHSRCVGVLEFVGYDDAAASPVVECIYDALKEVEMRTTPMIVLELYMSIWEYTSDDDRGHVNDRVKGLDLSLDEYDERHSVSESRKNLQMSDMDYKRSVEEQELIDIGKSMPGNDRLQLNLSVWTDFFKTLGDSISSSEKSPKNHEIDPTKAVEEQNQNTIDGANSNEGKEIDEKKTSFHISYEDLEPHFGKTLEEAANKLGVSRSTLKRARKDCGITRWPSNVKNKKNPSLFQTKPCKKPVQSSNKKLFKSTSSRHLISGSPVNSNVLDRNREVDICQETNVVTIKAKFKEDIVKFDMCLSAGLGKLMDEVAKRVNLMITDFKLKYRDDDDDDDLISLTCDEDLHYYVKRMMSLGKTTIQVLVHLVKGAKVVETILPSKNSDVHILS